MADQTSALGHYCLTDGELPYFLRCAEGKGRQINGCCSGGAAEERAPAPLPHLTATRQQQ